MAGTSGRLIVGFTAMAIFFGLVVGVFSLTTGHLRMPGCPQCCSEKVTSAKKPERTIYLCGGCGHGWEGAARYDFSWMAAVECWAEDSSLPAE